MPRKTLLTVDWKLTEPLGLNLTSNIVSFPGGPYVNDVLVLSLIWTLEQKHGSRFKFLFCSCSKEFDTKHTRTTLFSFAFRNPPFFAFSKENIMKPVAFTFQSQSLLIVAESSELSEN